MLVGEGGVGKTSLLFRFTEGTYHHEYIKTMGVDFKFKPVQIGDKNIKLQIFDTAG